MALSIGWRGLTVPQINIPENDTPEKIGEAARGIYTDIRNHQAAGAIRGEEASVRSELYGLKDRLSAMQQRRDKLKSQSNELGNQIAAAQQAKQQTTIVPQETPETKPWTGIVEQPAVD